MSMNECVAATTPEEDTLVEVKNVVYTWVLANHPYVIEMAKDMASPDWETLTDAWQD